MNSEKEWKSLGIRIETDEDGAFRLVASTPKGRRYLSASGSGDRQTYIAQVDGDNLSFVEDKVIDQHAYIQSFRDECLIENIIKRAAGGDETVLSKVQGQYGDFTAFPSDLRGVYKAMENAKGVFDGLSEEEKAKYGDDFDNFLGTFASVEGIVDFVQSQNPQVATQTEEVNQDAT